MDEAEMLKYVGNHFSSWLPELDESEVTEQNKHQQEPLYCPSQEEASLLNEREHYSLTIDTTVDWHWTGPAGPREVYSDPRAKASTREVLFVHNMHRCCKSCHK